MNNNKSRILFILFFVLLVSCQESQKSKLETIYEIQAQDKLKNQKIIREKVLTSEEQKALTTDQVIEILKEGNKRFVNNDLTKRDHSVMVRDAIKGQYPKAVILSCLNSRVPVEEVFDRGIGDVFVARIAGNFVKPDIHGSIEYGFKVSGAKVILVLGHLSCGAIKRR